MSHELQTPLTLVSGSLRRVLRKAPDLEPSLAQRLRDAEEETRSMQQLLNDLLDLSRGDSGRLQVKQEPVALRPLLATVVRVQAQTLDRTIQLALPASNGDASEPSERALADEARLHQVLLNLIENAHKYSLELPIQLRLLRHHHASFSKWKTAASAFRTRIKRRSSIASTAVRTPLAKVGAASDYRWCNCW